MYSKINLEDAEWRTQTDEEPAVKTLGYELKAAGEDRPNEMRFNYFHYEPGDAVRRHKQIDQEEVFFIIEGSGTFEVDGEEFPYESGDTIVVDAGPMRQIIAEEETYIFAVGAPNLRDDAVFEDELEDDQ
ncbi:cupin domain-containing protein [Halobacteria archaeon AArc-curdl1]|uniref:Cupin domain-containing protein n=1 Tax=Natronosalvus hydrolyticus TaxID=2979988 RepID=A0AAP2ZA38_9EURY|nr:cupin domain-containing protein [Halobacteria archaeon AArc-curdl1]